MKKIISIIILLMLVTIIPATTAAPTATVKIDMCCDEIEIGDIFTIDILVEANGATYDCWNIKDLHFPSGKVEATNISITSPWNETEFCYPKTPMEVAACINNSAGKIKDPQSFLTTPATNDTTLCTITFKAKANGQCTFKFNHFALVYEGENVPFTTLDKTITIGNGGSPPPPPPPPPTNQPPIAIISGYYYNKTVNDSITFNATNSYDPDGRIVSWIWDFGDHSGIVAGPDASSIAHTYKQPGNYTITLKIFDDDGARANATTYATIWAEPTEPTEPDEPDEPDIPPEDNDTTPATADDFNWNIIVLIGLATFVLVIISYLIYVRRK